MPSKHTAGCLLLGLIFVSTPLLRAQPGGGFNTFSDSLVIAIESGNTDWIFSRVDSSVFNGFGYNSGIETFKRLWNDPVERFGEELLEALQLGPAFTEDGNRLFVPFLWLAFPDTLDAYRYGYVLKEEVTIYAAPDSGSKVLGSLSPGWTEVENWFAGDTADAWGDPLWISVVVPGIGSGYVKSKQVRSPIDYRFWFEKVNSRWMLMGWAAGD